MTEDAAIKEAMQLAEKLASIHAYKYKQDKTEVLSYLLDKLALLWNRYDPDRGISFAHYASSSLKGYLLNYLRDMSRIIKVPRQVLYLHLREKALLKNSYRYRTEEDLARDLGVSVEELRENRTIMNYTSTLANPESALDYSIEAVEDSETVKAVKSLDPDVTTILEMRYLECMTWASIARRMGITERKAEKLANEAKDMLSYLVA